MVESKVSIPLTKSRVEQIFPTLSEAQMARLGSHGTSRSVPAGEVLVELGGNDIPVFLVVSGELEVVRPSFTQEILIRVIGPGQFTGEINTLSGRRAFARIRARQNCVGELANRSPFVNGQSLSILMTRGGKTLV
jgi:thioredoxin reductase (NADPH)